MTTPPMPAPGEISVLDARSAPTTRLSPHPGFRPDIQGLRAIAVLAVVTFHVNPQWLPGGFVGVDVFFVISGFLITLQLIGEVRRTGTLSLTRFWSRRILRLIPAATVVLVTAAGMVMVTTPRSGWVRFGIDFAAAGGYSLNWVLAKRSVNYLAEDEIPSPVQHYWSLGVEEQFYLLWPVVILGVVILSRRWRVRVRPLLLGTIAIVAIPSLGYAAFRVAVGDPLVFFVTTSRLWELAIGAIAALIVPRVHSAVSVHARGTGIAIGLALIAGAAVLADDTHWPAWLALVPTLGTALVLLGGGRIRRQGDERLLAAKALVWVGGVSYSLYLWHWPVINFAHRRWGDFTVAQTLTVVVSSLGLAWLTQRFVEDPIRFAPWFRAHTRRAFGLGSTCLGIGLAMSVTLVVLGPRLALVPLDAQPSGAIVLPDRIDLMRHPVWSEGVKWALPTVGDSAKDVPRAYADGCQQSAYEVAPLSCAYGDLTSNRLVALVGDSKVLQWLPALDTWASQHKLRIITYTKSTCPLADIAVALPNGQPYPSCREWYGEVMAELMRTRPSLVITSQFHPAGTAAHEIAPTSTAMVSGLKRTWNSLTHSGIAVVVIADTPHPPSSISECVIEFDRDLGRCEYARAPALAASAQPSQLAALNNLHGSLIDASGTVQRGANFSLVMIDLTDLVCPDLRTCPPVIGNVLIYRSGSHITKTYVDSSAARLARLLDGAGVI